MTTIPSPYKVCSCGVQYTLEAWCALPYVGVLVDPDESFELRNCVCGSTLAVPVAPDAQEAEYAS